MEFCRILQKSGFARVLRAFGTQNIIILVVLGVFSGFLAGFLTGKASVSGLILIILRVSAKAAVFSRF